MGGARKTSAGHLARGLQRSALQIFQGFAAGHLRSISVCANHLAEQSSWRNQCPTSQRAYSLRERYGDAEHVRRANRLSAGAFAAEKPPRSGDFRALRFRLGFGHSLRLTVFVGWKRLHFNRFNHAMLTRAKADEPASAVTATIAMRSESDQQILPKRQPVMFLRPSAQFPAQAFGTFRERQLGK